MTILPGSRVSPYGHPQSGACSVYRRSKAWMKSLFISWAACWKNGSIIIHRRLREQLMLGTICTQMPLYIYASISARSNAKDNTAFQFTDCRIGLQPEPVPGFAFPTESMPLSSAILFSGSAEIAVPPASLGPANEPHRPRRPAEADKCTTFS